MPSILFILRLLAGHRLPYKWAPKFRRVCSMDLPSEQSDPWMCSLPKRSRWFSHRGPVWHKSKAGRQSWRQSHAHLPVCSMVSPPEWQRLRGKGDRGDFPWFTSNSLWLKPRWDGPQEQWEDEIWRAVPVKPTEPGYGLPEFVSHLFPFCSFRIVRYENVHSPRCTPERNTVWQK